MKRVAPIEIALEVAASTWVGACTGIGLWLAVSVGEINLPLLSLSGGAVACVLTLWLLHRWRDSSHQVPTFTLVPIEAREVDELLLTDEMLHPVTGPIEELVLTLEQRLEAQRYSATGAGDELLLEDVLAEITPESRVIHLFDPAAMPTAGELRSRIDRHLQNREAPTFPDAAQALNDALADLRRSLR